jgi:hypothetical protein
MDRAWRHPGWWALALLLSACGGSDSPPTSTGPPPEVGEVMPDFALLDVNPGSPRSGQVVSPRDYLGQVSAWYFGHAT